MPLEQTIIIEGEIVRVMESWPLQLAVETEAGVYHVELLDETKVIQEERTINPGILTPHLHIRIQGFTSRTTPLAMLAQEIEILPDPN